MDKNLYGRYLEYVGNKEVELTSCVVSEVWVSTNYPFQDIFSPPSM